MSTPNQAKKKSNEELVTFTWILTAYKFYKMKSISCNMNNPREFMLSTDAKTIWQTPLLTIHESLMNQSIHGTTSYTIKHLYDIIAMHDQKLKNNLRKENADKNRELIRKLQIIYYSIVFDNKFRNMVFVMFNDECSNKHLISLQNKCKARVTHGIMEYPGKSCLECKDKLSYVYRSSGNDCKGSIAIVYHRRKAPKICNSYQKQCRECGIYYNYNRIDYKRTTKHKAKINRTIYLDPDALPYYSIAGKGANNYIHHSIYISIQNHQYCNKSQSIDIWLQHYNEECEADYNQLSKIKDAHKLSMELGYRTVLRYFYFYALLCRTRGIEDFGSIVLNGRVIKIALIVTNADKEKILSDISCLKEAKIPNVNKSADIGRIAHHQFTYFVNKYYQQLITSEVSELKEVPVRINKIGIIEIYPGWFIVYGDGGEKITRIRCAYPAILGKLDYMEQTADNTEAKVNDINDDNDDIDLAINNNSRLYSSQRYYECDDTPYFNDRDNNRRSYKCCKHHVAKLIEHGIQLTDISEFTTWYQWHTALAKMMDTNIQETIKAQYTIEDEVLHSIKTKHKTKITDLKYRINNFIQKHPQKHFRFETFVDEIHNKINNFRQRLKVKRAARERGEAKRQANSTSDNTQLIANKLRDILGDDDFELDRDIMQTSVRDLLALELNNNKYLDKHKGCRKSKYFSAATTTRTKGLNVLCNTAGVIIELREEIVRETPTAVILDIAHTCTNHPTSIQYANRIEAIGYDMMCRMYYHLETLIKNKRLPAKQEAFWCDLIWRAFIDIWHVYTHTDELCQATGGIFHPKLPKFAELLYNINEVMDRVNDIIAEQFWSTMNATSQLKSMNKETFLIFLLEKRSYCNQAKIKELKKKGWTFIPIEWCTSLRNIESQEAELPSKEALKAKNNIALTKVHIKPDKIQQVKNMINEATADKTNSSNKRKRNNVNNAASPKKKKK